MTAIRCKACFSEVEGSTGGCASCGEQDPTVWVELQSIAGRTSGQVRARLGAPEATGDGALFGKATEHRFSRPGEAIAEESADTWYELYGNGVLVRYDADEASAVYATYHRKSRVPFGPEALRTLALEPIPPATLIGGYDDQPSSRNRRIYWDGYPGYVITLAADWTYGRYADAIAAVRAEPFSPAR